MKKRYKFPLYMNSIGRDFALLFFVLAVCVGSAQGRKVEVEKKVRIGFWNVQNLFDTINDPGVADGQYTPQGQKKWNSFRYNEKIAMLAQCVDSMAVDLLGLCEVENRGVVEDLESRLNRRYDVVHFESCDVRGIDQAILYDRSKFKHIESGLIETSTLKKKREILYASFVCGSDTVQFYVLHLPSKLGGERAAVDRERIVRQIDSLVYVGRHKSVVMGDMNDDPIVIGGMENCAEVMHKKGMGSYSYRGVYSMLDQILLSYGISHQGLMLMNNYGKSAFGRKKRASDHKGVAIDLEF